MAAEGGGRVRRGPTERAIASEFACTEQEANFVRTYVAMGQELGYAGECFKRAFCRLTARGELVRAGPEIPIDALEDAPAYPRLDDRQLGKLGRALLELGHVSGYLEELNLSTSDAARVDLRRQLLVGDENQRAKASARVLDEEDKHRLRDDVERYKDILRRTGVPIVIPLPEMVTGYVTCPECQASHRVELALDLTAQFSSMFPPLTDAGPVPESE